MPSAEDESVGPEDKETAPAHEQMTADRADYANKILGRHATQTASDFEVYDFVAFDGPTRRVHGWVTAVETDYVVVRALKDEGGDEHRLSPTELTVL